MKQTNSGPVNPGSSMTRRRALGLITGSAAATMVRPHLFAEANRHPQVLAIDPEPLFELSPYLHMQFMEPLGTTDGSVEAAWDHLRDRWRSDVIEAARDLSPAMLRWGGIFMDFYRWREGVGPRDKRPSMHNLCWGGMESNQVGTAEFVDFCKQVAAEPLMCVNFESDGRKQYLRAKDSIRTADATEAAAWVAYCNDPANEERRGHGLEAPIPIKYWQIGNETSYDRNGFDLETAAAKTVTFARAMRRADPGIKLIAWGDSGWAARMAEVAGDHVQMLAFHHMFNPDDPKRPVLQGELYRRDPDATWHQLMQAWKINDAKIREARESRGPSRLPLAMTECHFAIPGRDRCDVLSTWAAGVSYARILNNHQRHGDVLKIATAADFCGTRWQVNAIMIPVPRGQSYLMPVARVMQLYRRHMGTHAIKVSSCPEGLDVVASGRRDGCMFLHVVNTSRTKAVKARLVVDGLSMSGGRAFEISDDSEVEVSQLNSSGVMRAVEKSLTGDFSWEFPPASVSAVELH